MINEQYRPRQVRPEELDEVGSSIKPVDGSPDSPLVNISKWYRDFIDPDSPDGEPHFPHAHSITYNKEGWTGPETKVETEGVTPKGEFTVKD